MPVSDKKKEYGVKLGKYIEKYKAAFIVGCDNVGSKQMQSIRISLRALDTVVLMGKNTTIRKVIKDYLKKNDKHPIACILEHMVGNVGLVFTNSDLSTVRDTVLKATKPAPARVGSFAPVDVFVEPGPTGCDPGQTAWFQALNIPTKINKGQIEMISRVKLLSVGDKVGDSAAALLQKLNIKPFSYCMKVSKVYDKDAGIVYPQEVLDTKEEDILAKFMGGVSLLAAASLGLGLPTKASVVHSVNNAYKALLAIGLGTDYKFKQLAAFEEAIKNPGAFASAGPAAPAAGGAAPAKVEEKKEEKKEEEEEAVGAGGLFGGGDDDW
jgi:large subunit ribosomal protein LP0